MSDATDHDPTTDRPTGRWSRRRLLEVTASAAAAGLAGCARRLGLDADGRPGESDSNQATTPRSTATTSTPARVAVRRSSARGHANHGWLDTYHTFSFANYHDPAHMGFGPLRVINQDRVTAGRGFPMHGHRDMEIVSYVLEGTMAHEDTLGNGSTMRPGDVQLMSAGRGVQHSEFNADASAGLHFLQMWVLPGAAGAQPRYEQKAFTRAERQGRLKLVVSANGRDGSLTILQDARLHAGLLAPGQSTRHLLEPGRGAWLHVATGAVTVNGVALGPGDGAALTQGDHADVTGTSDAELVVWDVPVA